MSDNWTGKKVVLLNDGGYNDTGAGLVGVVVDDSDDLVVVKYEDFNGNVNNWSFLKNTEVAILQDRLGLLVDRAKFKVGDYVTTTNDYWGMFGLFTEKNNFVGIVEKEVMIEDIRKYEVKILFLKNNRQYIGAMATFKESHLKLIPEDEE